MDIWHNVLVAMASFRCRKCLFLPSFVTKCQSDMHFCRKIRAQNDSLRILGHCYFISFSNKLNGKLVATLSPDLHPDNIRSDRNNGELFANYKLKYLLTLCRNNKIVLLVSLSTSIYTCCKNLL